MLLSCVHKIVAIPWIYDLCQWLAGGSTARMIFRQEFAALAERGYVLDVGGGTGLNRPYLPIGWKYFCLDPDPQKLEGFRARFPSDEAVKASACEIPFDNESIDLCIMTAVSHHLTNEKFRLALCEIRRVLRPGGKFMLMDAVWNPANLIGRFLWSLDRGSFPRNTEKLEHFIQTELFIERRVFWKVHHEYALFWCSKKDR